MRGTWRGQKHSARNRTTLTLLPEYRTALAETPNDLTTELAYADALYRMRRYAEAVAALNAALKLSPSDPAIYALMAQVHAKKGDREQTLRDIEAAEKYGEEIPSPF